jgi:3-oxoacyl-[acyl-carrier protein] reductase
MNLMLDDKIALVTGASSGIGAAAARLFAAEGADVIVCYHSNHAGASAAAEQVRGLGRRAWLVSMDITQPEAVASVMEGLLAEIPGIDALVLCSGHNIVTPFDQLGAEEWRQVLDINLNGPFNLLHAAVPLLRDGAGVVTVASVAAHTGAPHHAHYAAAKAGLINLTKSAARALAPRVRVNCVAPGITRTPMGEDTIANLDPDYARKRLLLQRYADPEEIARCIVFAASPANSFMTGTTIDVNGGRELR